jgi:diamine N-acetyltransferase
MDVRLEPVTIDNWEEVIKIDLPPEQWQNVDPPSVLHALCEAQFWPGKSDAVVDGDAMVGYVHHGAIQGGDAWAVAILIIDKNHQRKGYGRAAMERVIEQARSAVSGGGSILISYRPSNVAAEQLYASLGFKPEGEHEGDVLARLRF